MPFFYCTDYHAVSFRFVKIQKDTGASYNNTILGRLGGTQVNCKWKNVLDRSLSKKKKKSYPIFFFILRKGNAILIACFYVYENYNIKSKFRLLIK